MIDFGLFKNIERKQRIIDEKLYIVAKNREKRKRRDRKGRINLLKNYDSFIKVEENLESSSFDFDQLFTTNYYKDISEFKQNFNEEDISMGWCEDKIKQITIQPNKVFDYSTKNNKKPVILSRNIIDFIAPKKISPTEKNGKGNGWTKLFRLFFDETCSLNYSSNKELSLSMSNAWERDEEKKIITDKNFDIDLSRESSKMRMKETIQKYSVETQNWKEKSTNFVTTSENASSEKNKVSILPLKKPEVEKAKNSSKDI